MFKECSLNVHWMFPRWSIATGRVADNIGRLLQLQDKVYDANKKVENIMMHYRVTRMADLR
jgi:hypothetical protein